jgi:hypothetical protein
MKGTFAFTLTPKSSCAPDASGWGCDEIRLRGSFHLRSVTNILILHP